MAFVCVEQRNAHLAGAVRLEYVNGREGKVAKATLTAISNSRRVAGDEREDEATAVQWTLWGKQAENAAECLGKGSLVNVVGRLRNNNYRDAGGKDVYAFGFSCEEIDYLDSKAESEARRGRLEGPGGGERPGAGAVVRKPSAGRCACARRTGQAWPAECRSRRHRATLTHDHGNDAQRSPRWRG